MTITDELMNMDRTLTLHNEGEWNGGVSTYSAFNSGGVECEVGEFFYSLVRMIKPKNILETGTHYGIGASYMGMALRDNFAGHLDTLEYLPEIHDIAQLRMDNIGLSDKVTCHLIDARNFEPKTNYQLVLLDTEPQTRFAELLKFFPFVDEGGYMFIHDLGRHMQQMDIPGVGFAFPFGVLPEGIKELVREDKLRPFHFLTPRGFTGFYKTSKDDYVWNIKS